MFRKCLKYDLTAVLQYWWLLALGMLGASLLGGLAMRANMLLVEADRLPLLQALCILGFVACLFAILIAMVVQMLLTYWRFYKHLFSDEGYLTFTLPVPRGTLLLSKTVNAMIWTMSTFLLFVTSLVLLFVIGMPAEAIEVFRSLLVMVSLVWYVAEWWTIVLALELIVMLGMSMLFTISLIHFCITMGAMLAKKHKLIAAIGIYYAVNMAMSLITQVITLLGSLTVGAIISTIPDAGSAVVGGLFSLILLIACAMLATIAFTFYFLVRTKLERNLNLA